MFLQRFMSLFMKFAESEPLPADAVFTSGAPSFDGTGQTEEGDPMRIVKKGPAMRVIFFYPGEEGTYVDNANVTLYENGIIHIQSNQEETTTHLQNCEILWRFETENADDRASKLRLLKPKSSEPRSLEDPKPTAPTPPELQ